MKRSLIMLVIAAMSFAISPTLAQEPTPEPGPNAAKLLPDAGAFGKGWRLSQTVSPDLLALYSFTMSPDVFREGAASIYVGQGGSRIVVVSLLITNTRV